MHAKEQCKKDELELQGKGCAGRKSTFRHISSTHVNLGAIDGEDFAFAVSYLYR
jgi:hypothetical protein